MAEYHCTSLPFKDKFRIRIDTNTHNRSRKTIIKERYGYITQDAADLNSGKSLSSFVSTLSPQDNLSDSNERNKRSNDNLNCSNSTVKKSKVQHTAMDEKTKNVSSTLQITTDRANVKSLQEWKEQQLLRVQDASIIFSSQSLDFTHPIPLDNASSHPLNSINMTKKN